MDSLNSPDTLLGNQTLKLHSDSFTTKIILLMKKLSNLKGISLLRKLLTFRIRLVFALFLIVASFLVGAFISKMPSQTKVEEKVINQNHQADDITVRVDKAHLTNVIRFSQQGTSAPAGKDFLVIFTDVENASTSAKQLVYGNWYRLEENTNGDSKKLAPLPLNAQFTLPPQASLEKQIVFIVDEGLKNFNLLVGDIEKPQKSVSIDF